MDRRGIVYRKLGGNDGTGACPFQYAVQGQQTGQPGQTMITEVSHKEVMEHMGKDMILPVGVVEIPVQQALSDDREEAIAAIDKELKAMHVIRKRLIPVDEAKLTPMQKKAALECRFSITRKRVTPEQAEKGIMGNKYHY